MAANRHTDICTHNFRKCSHSSVGLAEAHHIYKLTLKSLAEFLTFTCIAYT